MLASNTDPRRTIMANAIHIVDLHQEESLSADARKRVVGGRDIAREKAVLEAYLTIRDIDKLLNEPEPAPAKVSMKLPG
ncbi:hypothetical protein [Cupriavidus plantarum]|uniref:hypothetical protein n=1 Tax=Cupriavidus plantarum TaxID=942865 RepID=UPI0011C39171|nr:hypothetical protein [Cupriavidus plantarum]NYI01617.1 hypothetical protein [Cupriavidus plantarum]